MDEKAATGIILLVIALFGIMLFFPIYSPTMYGGWGCPMGGRGYGHMMGGGFYGGGLVAIFLFDAIFLVILLLGIYLIWQSTKSTK